MKIENFNKEIITTNLATENESFADLTDDNFCIIPAKNLTEIKLSIEQLQGLLENENNKKYFPVLLSSSKIIISLKSINEISQLYEISAHLPKHWQLEMIDIYRNYKFNVIFQ